MEFFVYFFEVRVSDVRIDLGRTDVTVAEHALNTAEVGAVHEEIGRVTMAHGMRADVLGDAGKPGVLAHHPLDAPGREATVIASGLCGIVAAVAEEKRR